MTRLSGIWNILGILLLTVGAVGVVRGSEQAETPSAAETDKTSPAPEHESLSETKHTTVIGGKQIAYTATVGRILLRDRKDEDQASIFYFAYVADNLGDARQRPITFAFNGGPGSSSVWLHLGLLGPKRVSMKDDATPVSPPYQLIRNEHSLLDVTDIVMIDPVSTGISRQAKGVDAKQFHGYTEDIESVGNFIERFVTTNNRWPSPKFLLGESYGTTRAAGLSGHLQEQHGIYLNGIAMVSSVLNFQTLRFGDGNDLPYVLFLPSYTATAWYHKRLDDRLQKDLRRVLDEVEDFAVNEYSVALLKGAGLPDRDREAVTEKLARYTGLTPDFIRRSHMRVSMSRFAKELLRDSRRTTGRLDSRFLGIDRDAAGETYEYDPSNAAILGPFTAALNDYVRDDLKFELPRKYAIFGRVRPWSYEEFENRYLDASETLRQAMTKNPFLRVFVASGYYDLATPYFASDFTYRQLQLDPELQKNISFEYYKAGHMMYIHDPSLAKMKSDLAEFYRSSASP